MGKKIANRKISAKKVRVPKQQRSIERTEQILEAAKELIAEKGSIGLKIQDIAERAGITAGSMYQYFPNKTSIIHILGERYLKQASAIITERLQKKLESIDELHDLLFEIFIEYYELHRKDPVIRDIWLGNRADKSMYDMDKADTARNAKLLFDRSKHLFDEEHWNELKVAYIMLLEFTIPTIRVALQHRGRSRQAVFDIVARWTPLLLNTTGN